MPDGEPTHPYPSIQRINLRHEISPPPANVKRRRPWSDRFWWSVVWAVFVLLVSAGVRFVYRDAITWGLGQWIGLAFALSIIAAVWCGWWLGSHEPN